MKTTHLTNTVSERPMQRLTFPAYDEEDILNLDAVIGTPPPRPLSTIRVKLVYKGHSKPMPVEDPWHG